MNISQSRSVSHEEEKNSNPGQESKFSYFQLYRYSTCTERFIISIGILLAIVASVFIPYCIVIYGEFTSLLVDRTVGGNTTSTPTFILPLFGGGKTLINATREENNQAIIDDSIAFGLSSLAGSMLLWLLIAISVDIMNRAAVNQIGKIRKMFFEAMLRLDMPWYDVNVGTNFANKMTEELEKMKEGMGEKVSIFIFLVMTFVTGVVASFLYGWKLTMVVLTCCPFIILSTALVAKIQSSLTEKELQAYSGAGNVAEEVFSGIRTVFAFSGERKECERFTNLLRPAVVMGRKKGLYSGLGGGFMWLLIFCCNALAMWYGISLILEDRTEEVRHYTPAVLVIVLFGIIMGAENLGFSSPHLETFVVAKAATKSIFSIIDHKSMIDPLDEQGIKPLKTEGRICFKNVQFSYPSRPDVEILTNLTLDIEPGKKVAFVGASGCGKSTTLQLLQRFYEPLSGSVQLDGHDLRTLNVSWLRAQLGVVGQEPVLFGSSTIGENIRFGHPKASQKDIEQAARTANCHDFISKLPNGYETMVGERGIQMSGGQKQRIAIARALLRNPRVLLLDEATSALDTNSEKRVQDALKLASHGRTTLIVSHRLSTVTNADKIFFFKDGIIVEQGTHDELIALGGLYSDLVKITKHKESTEDIVRAPTTESVKDIQNDLACTSSDINHRIFAEKAHDNLIIEASQVDNGEFLNLKKLNKHQNSPAKEYKVSFRQLMKLNAPEWRYILCGCVAAFTHGATFPIWAVFFGNFFGIMSSDDADYIKSRANLYSYVFIGIGVVAGLGTFIQTYMFNIAGVKMTSRLRQTTFKTIISQEVAFFDDQRNSVGSLCARLAGDCSNIQGATGARIGVIIQAISTLFIGMIVAFIFSWNLTLLTLVTVPFVCFSIYLEARFMEAKSLAEKLAIEHASKVAVEAISNIRTIASLGQERYVLLRYIEQINLADDACRKKLRFRGIVFGFGQASPFLAYGVSLYYGGLLVANNGLAYENIIKVSEALIFGSWMLGQALAYAPNVTTANLSANRLIKLFERMPTLHNPADKPYNSAQKSEGDITYDRVNFEYPSRSTPILKDFNLKIKRGKTIALVGPSGSGKSTCVQLLLRYYDPTSGTVNLSGVPTTEFSFDMLRSKIGLVSQEPVLFDRTIAENIAYGDNFRDIQMDEIIRAAQKANIHNFVISLPNGYDTRLGNNGAQLSGGQKQRIAIARALVRNPKILILDEATSALDLESEKIVQEALEVARSGRTCITIAHRLTTVRDADLICVLKKGVLLEHGKHHELMALDGAYSELYMLQEVAN